MAQRMEFVEEKVEKISFTTGKLCIGERTGSVYSVRGRGFLMVDGVQVKGLAHNNFSHCEELFSFQNETLLCVMLRECVAKVVTNLRIFVVYSIPRKRVIHVSELINDVYKISHCALLYHASNTNDLWVMDWTMEPKTFSLNFPIDPLLDEPCVAAAPDLNLFAIHYNFKITFYALDNYDNMQPCRVVRLDHRARRLIYLGNSVFAYLIGTWVGKYDYNSQKYSPVMHCSANYEFLLDHVVPVGNGVDVIVARNCMNYSSLCMIQLMPDMMKYLSEFKKYDNVNIYNLTYDSNTGKYAFFDFNPFSCHTIHIGTVNNIRRIRSVFNGHIDSVDSTYLCMTDGCIINNAKTPKVVGYSYILNKKIKKNRNGHYVGTIKVKKTLAAARQSTKTIMCFNDADAFNINWALTDATENFELFRTINILSDNNPNKNNNNNNNNNNYNNIINTPYLPPFAVNIIGQYLNKTNVNH
jgi:hypothetical protein